MAQRTEPEPWTTSASAFERAVLRNWAERFGCAIGDFRQPGTVVIPDDEFRRSDAIHVWTIGSRAFARLDPAVAVAVKSRIGAQLEALSLTKELVAATLGPGSIVRAEESVLRYLYPPDFRPASAPHPYLIRALTHHDESALDAMKATCTPAEVEMGEVSVEDEIGFGCFDGDKMAAIATGFRLTGFMDIGVLTGPAYRRKGLGRAVVSSLCAWCIDLPVIAQYRCLTSNIGSFAIAQSLGFGLTFRQESIYLRDASLHA